MDSVPRPTSSSSASSCEEPMDPVSIISSIVGLVAAATSVFKSAYGLRQTIKDCPKDILALADDVARLIGVLHVLLPPGTNVDTYCPDDTGIQQPLPLPSTTAKSFESSSGSVSSPDSPNSAISESEWEFRIVELSKTKNHLSAQLSAEIVSCGKTLRDAEVLIVSVAPGKGEMIANVKKLFRWASASGEIKRIRRVLESHKSAFALILSAQGTYAPSRETVLIAIEIFFEVKSMKHGGYVIPFERTKLVHRCT
jgi:hypothetical protein